jgi:hypothetical protein
MNNNPQLVDKPVDNRCAKILELCQVDQENVEQF